MAAQFFSSLADNALLVVAIALLVELHAPAYLTPMLKFVFVLFYVILAPFVGAFADSMAKGRVMFISNTIKILGCSLLFLASHQYFALAAYAVVGLGAAAYSPAKYGILTELLPPEKLVIANGWIEGLTVASIVLGTVLGGLLISPAISSALLAFDFPLIETGVDTIPEAGILLISVFYSTAAIFNLYIPNTGVDHRILKKNPMFLMHEFGHCMKLLWTDKLGQISLAVTTLFWGAGRNPPIYCIEMGRCSARLPFKQGGAAAGCGCRRDRGWRGACCTHCIAAPIRARDPARHRDGHRGYGDDPRARFVDRHRAFDVDWRIGWILCGANERIAATSRAYFDGRRSLHRCAEFQ